MGHGNTERRTRGPPLPPDKFAAALAKKSFSRGEDVTIVAALYRGCLHDGFGSVVQLSYPRVGWGDGELQQLAETLEQVTTSTRHTRVDAQAGSLRGAWRRKEDWFL